MHFLAIVELRDSGEFQQFVTVQRWDLTNINIFFFKERCDLKKTTTDCYS